MRSRKCGMGLPPSFFFRSSKSKFPPANFGSIIEVIWPYVGNPSSDQLAGGVERKGLIPRVGRCLICRSQNLSGLSMIIPPPAGHRSNLPASSRPFSPILPPRVVATFLRPGASRLLYRVNLLGRRRKEVSIRLFPWRQQHHHVEGQRQHRSRFQAEDW